jgi:hypothetical protein
MALGEKPLAKMTAQEARASGHENATLGVASTHG